MPKIEVDEETYKKIKIEKIMKMIEKPEFEAGKIAITDDPYVIELNKDIRRIEKILLELINLI